MHKTLAIISSAALALASLAFVLPASGYLEPSSGGCVSVSTSRGTLTAAVVATSSQTVSGDVNATNCDIGVYVGAGVSGVTVTATVHDANRFGIYNDGGEVIVDGSTVSKIGNHAGGVYAPNGVQTGIGVLFDPASSGMIINSAIYNYQKGGIVVKGAGTSAVVSGNTVTGAGRIDYIAQNGIQISAGAVAELLNNTVTGHFYETGPNMAQNNGPWISCGLLFYLSGMPNSASQAMSVNVVRKNQVNLCNF